MGYVTPIVEAGLSSKKKHLKHSRVHNFNLVLLSYKFCVKIRYVAQTEVAILSYKEKALVHD